MISHWTSPTLARSVRITTGTLAVITITVTIIGILSGGWEVWLWLWWELLCFNVMLHYWDTSDNWVALQFVVALYTVTATQIDIIPLLVHYVIFLIGKWIQIYNEDCWMGEEDAGDLHLFPQQISSMNMFGSKTWLLNVLNHPSWQVVRLDWIRVNFSNFLH